MLARKAIQIDMEKMIFCSAACVSIFSSIHSLNVITVICAYLHRRICFLWTEPCHWIKNVFQLHVVTSRVLHGIFYTVGSFRFSLSK